MFFRKRQKTDPVLLEMDGREVKYVTRRVRQEDGTVKEVICGKTGRIAVVDGEIRVLCEARDVFRCAVEEATYFTLMSGNGITVSGVNALDGQQMDIVVYYSYHRK